MAHKSQFLFLAMAQFLALPLLLFHLQMVVGVSPATVPILQQSARASEQQTAGALPNGTNVLADDISFSAADCASLPPALWCAKFVRYKCFTNEFCRKHDDAVRYKPLHITLLYESLCPFCQRFIKDTLFDVYNRFRTHIKLELVPYGNAKINDNQFSCQHGEEECRINKFQSCAINYLGDPMPFVYCLETLLHENVTFDEAKKLCFNMINPGKYATDRITQCFDGPEGINLQNIAAQKTKKVWPNEHKFVPWILVNNVSIESMQFLRYSLPSLICEQRAEGEYLAECENW